MGGWANTGRRWVTGIGVGCGFLAGSLFGGLALGDPGGGRPPAHAAATPAAALDDLQKMDHELHGAIADASRYQRIRQPVEAIKHIEAKLIDTQFDQPVDGVRGSSWFQDLYCMDAELQLAQGTDEQQSGTVGPRGTGNPVKDFLEGAQQCKRRLERAIQEANGTGGGT